LSPSPPLGSGTKVMSGSSAKGSLDVDGALGASGPRQTRGSWGACSDMDGGAMARRRPEGSLARMQGSETRACVSGSAG
jgi:hypothetical protein